MEEAEALATNVAIMGTRMLAAGTLSSLQEAYGGSYSVRAVRVPGSQQDDVKDMILARFGGMVSAYEDRGGQIGFCLPHEKRLLGAIMTVMESLKGNVVEPEEAGSGSTAAGGASSAAIDAKIRVLQDYTITGPTLEEVFMNVAKDTGTTVGV